MMLPILSRAAAAAAALALLTCAAEAHRLKLFATVEDGVVKGYGFFIGGGRPGEAQLVIRNRAGAELYRGPAGGDASFTFRPATGTELFLVMDAGDGHVADTHIAADRFPDAGLFDAVATAKATEAAPASAATSPDARASAAVPAQPQQDLAALVDRSVDRAVSRQIAPLLEAYAEADGRMRFNDVVSGIAMIIGLSGLLLWARSRRRKDREPPAPGDQA
ncbi:MAG TPA: cobalamin biosynthesis protein CbiM [Rhizobiaceae bacterium]